MPDGFVVEGVAPYNVDVYKKDDGSTEIHASVFLVDDLNARVMLGALICKTNYYARGVTNCRQDFK